MSIASVNQFYQVAMQDPDLKQQFHTASASKSDQDILQMAVEQGQKHGYSFTTEEVAQAIAATQLPAETDGNVELSDHQLEAVAGGKGPTSTSVGQSANQVGRDVADGFTAPFNAVGGFVGGFVGGLFS
jgi:predicted ribosomally synthesized peptide with nif11-like leader